MRGISKLRRLLPAVALVFLPRSTLGSLRQGPDASHWVSTLDGGDKMNMRRQHQSTFVQPHPPRRLEVSELDEMMAKASQGGRRVRKAIKELRGGSEGFYQDLVTAVRVQMCDSDEAKKTRFVSKSDDRAFKYDDGSCVKLVNSTDYATVDAYYQQLCEVKPNCHWADFDPLTDTIRETTYAKAKTMTPDDARTKIGTYSNSVIVFAVPGIVFSVLSLLTMFFFFLCRCCCNKCGGRKPRVGGYSCMEKFLPVLFFILFGVGIGVCAGAAFFHREIALNGISDTFDGASHTIRNASEWTYEISAPLESVRDTVLHATANISSALSGLGGIGGDLDTFVGLLNALTADVNVSMLPEGCDPDNDFVCIACGVCSLIGSEVAATVAQIKANAEPAVVELEAMHSQVEILLVSIASEVRDDVNEQVDMIAGIRGTLDNVQDQVDNVQGYFGDYKPAIAGAIRAMFAVGLMVVGIGVIGVVFGLSPLKTLANIMHLAYFFGFIALFVCFLISAIALAVSILMGDTCEVVDMFSRNWTVPLGDDAGRVANACFRNESLIDVLGLTDKLAFARGGIDFPDIDINNSTDFSQMTALADTILSTTAEDAFPVSGLLNDSIELLNLLTGQSAGSCTPGGGNYVADDTILTPWNVTSDPPAGSGLAFMAQRYHPYDDDCYSGNANAMSFSCFGGQCPFSLRVGQEYTKASSLYVVKATSENFVRKLQADINAIVAFSVAFVAKITDMVAAVYAVKDQLEASLIKNVNDFEAAMYCTFVADGYDEIFAALCGDVMPSLTMLSLLLYLAAFCLVPVNVCLIILAKRLRATGNGKHLVDNELADVEKEKEMEKMKAKEDEDKSVSETI